MSSLPTPAETPKPESNYPGSLDEPSTQTNPGLAGDRLVEGEYQPTTINLLPDGRPRTHNTVVNLILGWQNRQLNWVNPDSAKHVPTLEQEREARLFERQAKLRARSRADTAKGRVREL